MNFGHTIINLLEKNNMTQKELAARLQIPPTTLNGYIRNRHEPDHNILIKMADIFGVSIDHLLEHKLAESAYEKSLLKRFASLNPEQQELVSSMIDVMCAQNKRKK